jgi:hypothetical protein
MSPYSVVYLLGLFTGFLYYNVSTLRVRATLLTQGEYST